MQKNVTLTLSLFSVLMCALLFPGCEFIGDVFKAGIWVGIIVIVAILAVVGLLVRMFKK